MSFRFERRSRIALAFVTAALVGMCVALQGAENDGRQIIRIAADPNNLPFSNEKLEGFENKIAEIIARDLNAELQYSWRAQRRGFFRETLKSGDADVVMGVPVGFERALTTRPYYRSSYVFVTRKKAGLNVDSFDDPRLRTLRIGVQLVGADGANTPPAHALASRNIITNLVGYTLYGDYRLPNPPARIISAVANGEVDVAVVWGPLAGYFASREALPLQIEAISESDGPKALPLAFDIGIGVRKGNVQLRGRLNDVLERRKTEIERILADYGMPGVERSKHALEASR